jgi:hypothetical protein
VNSLKKIMFIVGILIFIMLHPGFNVSAETPSQQEEFVRMTIGFEEKVDLSLFDSYPHEVHHVIESLEAVSISLPKLSIDKIAELDEIGWMEEDQEIKVEGQVVDWGHEPVKVNEARRSGYTGQGVKVAVVDTGISGSHPDLLVRDGISLVEGVEALTDDNGHGTHVAGVIAGLDNSIGIIGVAPDVELYSIKALDAGGVGNQTDVVAGIEWAIENEMDIINLSITTSTDSIALKKIIEQANEKGIIVTAASGNDETGAGQPYGTDISYPARYDEVIGVGAIDQEMKWASFSFKGPSLEFAAPGERIYSTYISKDGSEEGYAYMSGTSMAAPYVAGTLALYKEAYPDLSMDELRALVQEKALDLGQVGRDDLYGYGVIQSPHDAGMKSFTDIKTGAWYSESIYNMLDRKLIEGYPDGTFRPQAQISREEAATIIGRALNLDGTERETIFPDVSADSYSSGFISSGYENSIITGFPDGTFKPKQSIERGDAALLLFRAFAFPVYETSTFSDIRKENYFYLAVSTLNSLGITEGYKDGTYRPDRLISRAEFSVMLSRALDQAN